MPPAVSRQSAVKRRCGKCGRNRKISEFGKHHWCCHCRINYRAAYKDTHGKTHSQLSNQRLRYETLVHYSSDPPSCSCCGEPYFEFLTIDHINGGGRQHRMLLGYVKLDVWLRANNYPPGYRVLCMNCNHAIGQYG